jgi:hypothetical protein
MSEPKLTLGKAIDQIIEALETFDAKDKSAILNTVCSHLQIQLAPAVDRSEPERPDNNPRAEAAREENRRPPTRKLDAGLDIRSLREEKKPESAKQMACLVAYYLQEHAPEEEAKQTVGAADMEKYFKQAGFKLPERLEQLLIDCKRSGYFEGVKRGEYKLNRVGYNLVTHSMPGKQPT